MHGPGATEAETRAADSVLSLNRLTGIISRKVQEHNTQIIIFS